MSVNIYADYSRDRVGFFFGMSLVELVMLAASSLPVLWAMSLHPEDRPQTVEDLRKALLGTWNPPIRPLNPLPSPTLMDLFASPVERTLAVVAAGVLVLTLIMTLVR